MGVTNTSPNAPDMASTETLSRKAPPSAMAAPALVACTAPQVPMTRPPK